VEVLTPERVAEGAAGRQSVTQDEGMTEREGDQVKSTANPD